MVSSKRYGAKIRLHEWKNGDVSYYACYNVGFNKISKVVGRKSEGFNEAKAMAARNKLVSESLSGANFVNKGKSVALTFNILAEEYFESKAFSNKSNHKLELMYVKHIRDFIGEKPFVVLSDKDISKIEISKKDILSKGSIVQVLKLIKSIVGFGVKRGYIQTTPFKDIVMPRVDNARLRFLTTEEIGKLYSMLKKDHLTMFVRLALNTGARANSIINLQYKNINFSQGTIALTDFKRGMTYITFLSKKFLDSLDRGKPNDYLVSYKGSRIYYGTLYKQMKPILDKFNKDVDKRDGKNRVVIHTLRHTFASHLAIKGVAIHTIQSLMNHKDINMTLRYAKLSPDSGRAELADLYI